MNVPTPPTRTTASPRKAAIYARVSTSSQTAQQQLDRLRPVAPGAEEFVDGGVSGRLEHRPALDRLKAEISAGEVGEVYSLKMDRLGRSARAVLDFFDFADRHGVRVVLVDQMIDTSTPMGRFARTVLAGAAELESDIGRERTLDAMAAIRAGTRSTRSGRPPGKPPQLTAAKVSEILAGRRRNPPTSYRALSIRLGLKVGTCRRAYSLASRGLPAFVNPAVRKGSTTLEPRVGS